MRVSFLQTPPRRSYFFIPLDAVLDSEPPDGGSGNVLVWESPEFDAQGFKQIAVLLRVERTGIGSESCGLQWFWPESGTWAQITDAFGFRSPRVHTIPLFVFVDFPDFLRPLEFGKVLGPRTRVRCVWNDADPFQMIIGGIDVYLTTQ